MIKPINKKILIVVTILAVIAVAVGLIVYFTLPGESSRFRGAVVSNGVECAEIGRSILAKDGSAADAAIATLFCEGVSDPHSMGLGGGFLATIYIKSTQFAEALIARETAPLAAHETMFVNESEPSSSLVGGLAVAVPSEIKGYYELHKKYGRLDWKDLITPTIELCENGHIVSPYLAIALESMEETILDIPSLREIYINPSTGKVYKKGDKIKRTKLANTLKMLVRDGPDSVYNGGRIGKQLVEDIQGYGGIITEEDLKQYKVRWVPPVTTKLNDYTVHTIPLPGSGPVLNLILNLLSRNVTTDMELFWHRTIEAFKHGFGLRTHLGDIQFLPHIEELVAQMSSQDFADKLSEKIKDNTTFEDFSYYGANYSSVEDYGTANIAVVAPNGDAITVTSTINMIFGALRVTRTGIILNDEMDDFSTPGKPNGFGLLPSPANFIKPKKMPLSSMIPTIILDSNNDPRLLIGAAGGSKIITSVALAIIRHLFFDEPLDNAIRSPRIHHQLAPISIQYENGYDQGILESLKRKGHKLEEMSMLNGFSAVTGISVQSKDNVKAVFDNRRPGSAAYH